MSGLRINTNISSLNALRNLHVSDRAQARSLERLSSGLRINRGADDPSGLVISERLGLQIAALKQDSENSLNAANLISTADSALQKVSDLLKEIEGSVQFALSTGSSSPDQIAAEQDSVDQAVAAIDRIANTTRFGDRALLNGASQYQLSSPVSVASGANGVAGVTALTDVNFRSVNFAATNTTRSFQVDYVSGSAQRAEIYFSSVSAIGATTLRVTGARGVADVVIGSGATATGIVAAVNAVSQQTGVFALASTAGTAGVTIRSEGFGSSEFISIQTVAGNLSATAVASVFFTRTDTSGLIDVTGLGSDLSINELVSDRGRDGQVNMNGVTYTGKGLEFSINTQDVSVSFKLNADLFHVFGGGSGTITSLATIIGVSGLGQASGILLNVSRTGLEFQMRENAAPTDRLTMGIQGVNAAVLGLAVSRDSISEAAAGQLSGATLASGVAQGGFLSTLKSGAGNDLTQNAANALKVLNESASMVAKSRGFLGAVVGFNIEPNIDSIDVAVENLSSSRSAITDLDFAEETANFTRTQILFQSGIAALASARLIPQAVLQLLGG